MIDKVTIAPERTITLHFDGMEWVLTFQQAAKLRNDLNELLVGPFLKAVNRAIDESSLGDRPKWSGRNINGENGR